MAEAIGPPGSGPAMRLRGMRDVLGPSPQADHRRAITAAILTPVRPRMSSLQS